LKAKKPKNNPISLFIEIYLRIKFTVNVIGVRLFVAATKEPRVNVVVFKAFWSTTNSKHGLKIKLSLPKVLLAAINGKLL
jgi:hypothetical protein